jgi:MYXO-CTERM domain-containing protein
MNMKRFTIPMAIGLLLGGGAWLSPQSAEACGGTFCDAGPQPMPVDQSGENILFVMRPGEVEVHIQIQYEGDAERFGWVIPVQSLPEVSVGSDPLFRNLLDGSVPAYGFTRQFDDCGSRGDDADGSPSPGDGLTSGGGDDGGEGGEDGGPDILLQETVGAFDIVVLEGGSVEQVVTWLEENDYQTDPASEPILQQYLDEGHLFAAVRLTAGVDTDEIHPIVLKFQSDEPCVPLRLTAIAATDDMDVRTFFLGRSRVVPRAYKHVLVNPLKIDWPSRAANYKEVVTMAVDADHANGRAFVTEYAGTSSVVSSAGIHSPSWQPSAFETIEPVQVIDQLTAQGLYVCDFDWGNGCGGLHPLVQPILDEFLPVPAGLTADEFYGDLAAHADQIDLEAWSAQGFADALAERIVEPGAHAVELLQDNPYLTRMYTTISPHEMTEDPMFHQNPDLPEVENVRNATQRTLCDGSSVWTLPDGREVFVPAGQPWPSFDDEMPWEAEVQETPEMGAPMLLVDNNELIDTQLAAWNAQHGWDGSGDVGGGADESSGGGGCGCDVSDPARGGWWALAFTLGFGVWARRRQPIA